MNIYAPPGTRVVFAHPTYGYTPHQETAAEHLVAGDVYTVESTDVGDFHTDVFLRERPGVAFNSVMFEEADAAQGDGVAKENG